MNRQAAAQRLWAGSTEVAQRFGARVASASLTAKGVGALVLWKAGPILLDAAHYQPLILPAAACAWCWAAWRAGRPDAIEQPAPTVEPDEQGPAQEDEERFLALLHQLLPKPGSRAHVAQVAEAWTGNEKDTAPVREMCAALGVEISRGVRVPGAGVSTGIHHAALPPLPDPLSGPTVAVVSAGQNEQHDQQQQNGATARIVPDPAGQPNRWAVVWDDKPTAKAS